MTMLLEEIPQDLSKILGDWALAAGRKLQSKQTGFVHYYYGDPQQASDTIPIYENVLFVLALLRTRMVEQVQEAKVLLKGILHFQNFQENDAYGNFPVYLHAYPQCSDSALSIKILAPLYWIIKQFGHVLGSELKTKLEKATDLLLQHSVRLDCVKTYPYFLIVRFACALQAFGNLWQLDKYRSQGENLLQELSEQQTEECLSTAQLGEILIGLQMVYPTLSLSPWRSLWQYIEHTWHQDTGTYLGPCIRERQEKVEPEPNLYDLYCGYFSRQFSQRASLYRPQHLYGILIQSTDDFFQKNTNNCTVKGQWKGQLWQTFYQSSLAYTLFEKTTPYQLATDKTYTPLHLIWGDLQKVHTFVCQGGFYQQVRWMKNDDSIALIFTLQENPALDECSQSEIEFFLDFDPEVTFTIDGHRTTTFRFGDRILVNQPTQRFQITFELLEGAGDFIGHITRGNRPSQVDLKREKRFHSHDWRLVLRTIRRQTNCVVRMCVRLPVI